VTHTKLSTIMLISYKNN